MAGCSSARCSSERRSLRRELDHWRKDLITCVGLESFAEFLMGPERFKEVMPFNGFEAVDCPDWEVSSECRLCHARREVVTESLEHHKELIERQRTQEETSTQDFPGSYVPFKFSSAQEAIRHLASHHASKQQQSSQSALQEDSDNLDSEEDNVPPSPQHNSCNGSSAKRLRNSPYFLKIPRVPFGHEAEEKVSHGHINDGNEEVHPTAQHCSIPATTMKTTSTSSTQHCNGTDPQPKQQKSHSVSHSYQHQALGKCWSSDKNVSLDGHISHQSPMRPNDPSPVPIEVQNVNSNTYTDTRCLDEDFLLWVIYSMGRKGRHSFSFEDLEMTCSNKVAGSVTDVVSQAKAAVPLTTTVHDPPTSADDKVQETPQEHTSTVCQLTSNCKRCHSSLQDITLDGLRNECNIEAGQLGAKNDPIVDVGKTINDSDVNFDEDKHFVDLHPLYLFKPISLSSDTVPGPLPSDKTGNVQDTDSDTSSSCSISPPSLSPVTGYDTCSERDQSQSSVYSLEENEDNNDGDDPPPPILSPMPTMPWSTTFCPALRKEPQSSMSREKDVCKALCPTDPENCSMGRDSGVNSCSSSKSTEASVCSNQNSTDFSCPPDDSCSGVGVVDNVHCDDTPSPSKIFSNRLYETKGPSINNLKNLSCIDTDVKVDTSENARKQASPRKGLATGHGPQHALKGRYLHCLPHRPLSGFAMFEKRKGKDDENKHVGMGHYLLNRTSTRKASLSDLQLQKARILPCHVRLRKLSSRQIPHHGDQPKRTAHVLQGRRIGRPRKWMWVKGRSGKLVRIPIPKKESRPSGVGDIEVLRKLRPSAQRVVRQAQLKTDQVFPSKKIVNSATGTALRPLPVRLAKINDKKFQNTPRRQYNHKGSHQSMQTKRDKAKPVTDVSYTFPHAKQSHTSVDGNEDQFDVKWAVATVCRCKKVQSADLPCTCTFVTSSLDRGCKVGNNVPSKKETVAPASMSAEPMFMRKQKRGNSQTRQKEVKPKTEMKLGIRTLPHRRARTKVLKAFHAIVLKKYQKPESFMPAAIRKLRQLPSRNKRLRESTKSMPSLSKTRRMHLLKTSQKTADCEISQRYCPTRELGIVPNGSSDSEKYKTVNDGDKDALINHTSEPVLEGGADGQYDCKGAEEQMQVEQFSVVLHPMSPSTVKPIIADASGIQSHLHDVSSSKSEESMEIMDMPAVKQEQQHPLDEPGIKSVVKVYEKRQLRVLPERVARLREEERKQQAKNTVTATMASPSLEKLMEFQNNSPFDKDASAEDMENPSLSVKTAEKPVVLNGKIDSKSNYKHNKHITNTMVHNNVQERTRIPDITCKREVEDIDDERKLRSLPCRMVAQAHDAWKIKKVRGRPRKHSQLPSDAKSMAKIHRGRPRKNVRPESLNNTIHTNKHVVETMSAEMKSGSICVDQAAVQSDDDSSERENCNPPHVVQCSLPDEATLDRELDTANIGLSSQQGEDSTTEINTTTQAAASTSGFLVKRKVTHCPKTDLRCECMSLNTSLTLQYQDAIISKGWVKTSEKPGRRDASIIQSLFTQPVTYDTIMRLVAVGSSKTGIFQSQEHMAFTQVAPAPQGNKGTHTQCNSSKSFKKKKKRFEDVSVISKDLTEDVPISPSKPITTPISSLRGTKQEKTPRTKINRQADRLRKTLRKFATKTPAKNRIIPYEDVGRRKCKAAKKLFIVPSNPSILWCNHPSSDSKTKGPKANISPNTGSLSGEKDSSKPPSTNTTLNVQPPTKGRIETISNTSSTTLSASSSDNVSRERGSLTGSPENVKKSQGKKSSKKYSNSPSSTSKGTVLSKVKPKKASNKKHKVDPATAIDKSDHRAESPSHTAQASRSSARIQKKQLLGFSICPCCALVEAEHFERFKKRVRVTKEKHQTEKVDLPAKHSVQTNEAKNTKKATGSASQSDKPFNLVSTKEMVQKSKDDRSPQNLASPGSYVNSRSDLPPVPCTSSEAVSENILDDVTYHVPQLGGSSSSPPISSTEQTSLSQWGNLTHGDQILKEDLGAKNQVASPEVNAVVQIGKVVPECEDVVSSPCEENEWLDEEGFAGPLDLRVSWKKSETL